MTPAGRLLAPAPVFFAIADELVDAPRQLIAEFVDVLRHRVIVRRFCRGLLGRLGRLSCLRLFQWMISRHAGTISAPEWRRVFPSPFCPAFALTGFGGQAPAQSARGWSAGRRNHLILCLSAGALLERVAFRHSTAAFLSPGPYFRARTGGQRPPRSGRLSPAFVRAALSPCGRPHVVGADGGPGPPGDGVTSPARRRRTLPASCSVLQEAPRVGRVIGI
jgi:hypothetical protein